MIRFGSPLQLPEKARKMLLVEGGVRKRTRKGISEKSRGEEAFAFHVKAEGLPVPEREYRFDEGKRLWRFDFAWPEKKIAVEIEGGIWSRGRHVRGSGFENDCRKMNEAAAQGWFVYRFSSGMVQKGEAIAAMVRVFERLILPETSGT